jgi:arginase family enzyme
VTVLLGAATALGSARPDQAGEPRRLREEGLAGLLAELGVEAHDLGDVAGLEPPWEAAPAGMRVRNVVALADQVRRIRGAVHAALLAHGPPLILLGGDAVVQLGGLAGMRDALGEDPGCVWLSPDPPLDTPETSSDGHAAGMALAVALGEGSEPLVDAAGGPLLDRSQLAVVAALGEVARLIVPEGPVWVAVEGAVLLPASLGIDAARQAALAVAVREPVAAVAFTGFEPALGGAVQVAALAAAALR